MYGLTANRENAEIRFRILTKVEQDLILTLQAVAEDCQRIVNVRQSMARIEERCN